MDSKREGARRVQWLIKIGGVTIAKSSKSKARAILRKLRPHGWRTRPPVKHYLDDPLPDGFVFARKPPKQMPIKAVPNPNKIAYQNRKTLLKPEKRAFYFVRNWFGKLLKIKAAN